MATIDGTGASDFLVGTADADLINGGLGNDTIRGLGGNDTLNGAEGNDDIDGGDGNDYLIGGAGNDTLQGGMNADTLEGGAGNDVLRGGKGHDSINGGDGDDTIYSGLGQDTLTGGSGSDVFVVRGSDANFPGALKAPTITDFVAGTDSIVVEGATDADITAALAAQTTVDGGVSLSINGATVVVKGTGLTSLTSANVSNTIPSSNAGETFTLTTAIESLTGTSGNDTFVATNTTLNTGDNINGGSGTDTLEVTIGAAATPIATLNSIENVKLTAGVLTNGSINAGNWTGVEKLTLAGLGVALADGVAGGATGWAVEGLQNNVTLGLSNITTAADGNAALYAGFASGKVGSATATLSLDLNGVVGATANTGVANIQVDTAGSDKFTKLNVSSAGTNRLQLEGTAAGEISLTEISVTGAGSTNLSVDGTNALVTNLAKVDASGASGALTMNISASTKDVAFTGSSGKNAITFGNGNNTITGGAADDTFTLGTGNNTVNAGAGNDIVIGTIASFTKNDSIDLGDGARDALVYTNAATLNAAGIDATALGILNGYKGIEVVGTQGALTAVDAGYFTQTIYRSTADLKAALTVTNVAGDTLELRGNGITTVDGDSLTVSGSLPNQTFTLELNGSAGTNIQSTNATAGNASLTIASGISTVNIVSTTTASATTGLSNSIQIATAAGAATHAVDNASAGSFVLTGNVDFNIGQNAATAGFTKAVDFNASAFTGKLNIVASAEADIIKGGTANDTIRAMGGNDQIDISAGGSNTIVFETTAALAGKDTITGFNVGATSSGGDVLNVSAFTGISAPAALTTISSLTGAATMADDSVNIINFGAAISSKDFGGANFGDIVGAGKVFAAAVADASEGIWVVQGTDQTHIYMVNEALVNGGGDVLEAGDVSLVAVLTGVTNADSFLLANFS